MSGCVHMCVCVCVCVCVWISVSQPIPLLFSPLVATCLNKIIFNIKV